MFNGFLMVFSLVLAGLTLWMVISRIVRSLGQMTAAMGELAGGETSVDVPCIKRRDEMGSMARAMLVFKENALRVQNMQAERQVLEKLPVRKRSLQWAGWPTRSRGPSARLSKT